MLGLLVILNETMKRTQKSICLNLLGFWLTSELFPFKVYTAFPYVGNG